MYGLPSQLDNSRYSTYGFDTAGRNGSVVNGGSGSTALYHHNGSRYGLGFGRGGAPDGKMNGLHGPKHKRGDMDRKSLAQPLGQVKTLMSTFFSSQSVCQYPYRRPAR